MNIAIGADHRGFHHKELIKQLLVIPDKNITWIDVGTCNAQRTDYPKYVQEVCNTIVNEQATYGILICGSGVGMSIAANRYAKVYAALVWNEEVARMSREDDNANVLVLPADFIDAAQSVKMIQAWLQATFKKGRYQERLNMIDELKSIRE